MNGHAIAGTLLVLGVFCVMVWLDWRWSGVSDSTRDEEQERRWRQRFSEDDERRRSDDA